MIATLARKELRTLVPLLALVLLLWGGDFLYEPLAGQPDDKTLADSFDLDDDDAPWGLLTFLLAFSLSAGLLVGERDRGTLEFLDALPVSRVKVFAVKVGIGLLVLGSGPLLGVFEACVFHALSRNSLDPGFHPKILGASLFLHVLQAFVFLAWGLLFSFLRRFAWIAAALVYLALGTLRDADPAFGLLDPRALTPPSFTGQQWVAPWRLLTVQAALAVAALALAGWLFCGAGERLLRVQDRLRQSRSGRLLLAAVALIALVAWGWVIGRKVNEEASTPAAPPTRISRLATGTYVFTFPAGLGDRAAALARESDAVHERVRRFLSAEPVGRITVNGTGIRASAGAEGLASWKSIRLDLPTQASADELVATLGHETAHVYAAALSDGRLETPFVNEGLARYLEDRLFHPPAHAARTRLRAAILRARRQVDFEELMDPTRLQRRYDPDVVYPLGAAFAGALVERYGDQAPGNLLRALGRDDAPTDLRGLDLWYDAFQEAGYDLELVVNGMFARLDADVASWQPMIDALPRLRGSVQTRGGRIGVEAQPRPDDPGLTYVLCRFRASLDAPRESWFDGESEGGTFWVSASDFPEGVLHYQLGLFDVRVLEVVWEPWTAVSLDR